MQHCGCACTNRVAIVRRIMLSGLTSSTRSGEPEVIDVAAGLESTNVVERLGAGAAAGAAGAAGALALADTAF